MITLRLFRETRFLVCDELIKLAREAAARLGRAALSFAGFVAADESDRQVVRARVHG
jgi:hypothetical protein